MYTTHSNWPQPRIWEGPLEAAASDRIRSKARGHWASKSPWKIGLLGPHRPLGCIKSTHPRKGTFIHRISYMSLQMCPTTCPWEILARTLLALTLRPITQERKIKKWDSALLRSTALIKVDRNFTGQITHFPGWVIQAVKERSSRVTSRTLLPISPNI